MALEVPLQVLLLCTNDQEAACFTNLAALGRTLQQLLAATEHTSGLLSLGNAANIIPQQLHECLQALHSASLALRSLGQYNEAAARGLQEHADCQELEQPPLRTLQPSHHTEELQPIRVPPEAARTHVWQHGASLPPLPIAACTAEQQLTLRLAATLRQPFPASAVGCITAGTVVRQTHQPVRTVEQLRPGFMQLAAALQHSVGTRHLPPEGGAVQREHCVQREQQPWPSWAPHFQPVWRPQTPPCGRPAFELLPLPQQHGLLPAALKPAAPCFPGQQTLPALQLNAPCELLTPELGRQAVPVPGPGAPLPSCSAPVVEQHLVVTPGRPVMTREAYEGTAQQGTSRPMQAGPPPVEMPTAGLPEQQRGQPECTNTRTKHHHPQQPDQQQQPTMPLHGRGEQAGATAAGAAAVVPFAGAATAAGGSLPQEGHIQSPTTAHLLRSALRGDAAPSSSTEGSDPRQRPAPAAVPASPQETIAGGLAAMFPSQLAPPPASSPAGQALATALLSSQAKLALPAAPAAPGPMPRSAACAAQLADQHWPPWEQRQPQQEQAPGEAGPGDGGGATSQLPSGQLTLRPPSRAVGASAAAQQPGPLAHQEDDSFKFPTLSALLSGHVDSEAQLAWGTPDSRGEEAASLVAGRGAKGEAGPQQADPLAAPPQALLGRDEGEAQLAGSQQQLLAGSPAHVHADPGPDSLAAGTHPCKAGLLQLDPSSAAGAVGRPSRPEEDNKENHDSSQSQPEEAGLLLPQQAQHAPAGSPHGGDTQEAAAAACAGAAAGGEQPLGPGPAAAGKQPAHTGGGTMVVSPSGLAHAAGGIKAPPGHPAVQGGHYHGDRPPLLQQQPCEEHPCTAALPLPALPGEEGARVALGSPGAPADPGAQPATQPMTACSQDAKRQGLAAGATTPLAPVAPMLGSQRDSNSPHARTKAALQGACLDGAGIAHAAAEQGRLLVQVAPLAAAAATGALPAAPLVLQHLSPGSAAAPRKRPLSQDPEGNYKRSRFAAESQEAAAAAVGGGSSGMGDSPAGARQGSQAGAGVAPAVWDCAADAMDQDAEQPRVAGGSPAAAAALPCALADEQGMSPTGGPQQSSSPAAAGTAGDPGGGRAGTKSPLPPAPSSGTGPLTQRGASGFSQGGDLAALAPPAGSILPGTGAAWGLWGSEGETALMCTQPGSQAQVAPAFGQVPTAGGPQLVGAGSTATPATALAALASAERWAAASTPRPNHHHALNRPHLVYLPTAGSLAVPAAAGLSAPDQHPLGSGLATAQRATPAAAWLSGVGWDRATAAASEPRFAGAAPGATPRHLHLSQSPSPLAPRE
ncbi:hypothetical protein N2152v2_004623 [Parachlorella kessleri]